MKFITKNVFLSALVCGSMACGAGNEDVVENDASTQEAALGSVLNGFEGAQASAWLFNGNAGVDVNVGNARNGTNNGWVHNWSGWNAVYASFATQKPISGKSVLCTASAWIRSSSNLSGAYLSVLNNTNGALINEVTVPAGAAYALHQVSFFPTASAATVRIGFWGNGQNAWLQVDDVVVSCEIIL